MTNFYVDTSALNKRYVTEKGSAWVRSWIRATAGNAIIVCDLTPVEMFSVYARLNREGRLSLVHHIRLQSLLLGHMEQQYLVIRVDTQRLLQARSLVNHYPLRALDAIHLASALYAARIINEPITFVTADKQLRTAALHEGFAVEDPNAHP